MFAQPCVEYICWRRHTINNKQNTWINYVLVKSHRCVEKKEKKSRIKGTQIQGGWNTILYGVAGKR